MHRTSLVASLCLLALAACHEKPADVAGSSATAKADAACASRPPESAADYQQKLSLFKSAAGFAPDFKPGAVLSDGQEIAITVSEPGFDDGLSYDISYLAHCAVFGYFGAPFQKQPDGRWTTTVHTGTGADIPDGTPAFIEVTRTTLLPAVDGGLPKARTTVVGEYAVRIDKPKQ